MAFKLAFVLSVVAAVLHREILFVACEETSKIDEVIDSEKTTVTASGQNDTQNVAPKDPQNGAKNGTAYGAQNGAQNGAPKGAQNGSNEKDLVPIKMALKDSQNDTQNGAPKDPQNGAENSALNGARNGTENGYENVVANGAPNGVQQVSPSPGQITENQNSMAGANNVGFPGQTSTYPNSAGQFGQTFTYPNNAGQPGQTFTYPNNAGQPGQTFTFPNSASQPGYQYPQAMAEIHTNGNVNGQLSPFGEVGSGLGNIFGVVQSILGGALSALQWG